MQEMFRGDTRTLQTTIYQDAEQQTPYENLETCQEITVTARFGSVSGDVVFQKKKSEDNVTIDDPENGIFSIVILPEDTETLPSRTVTLMCDVELILGDGTVITPERFSLRVHSDVTY